MNNEKLIDASKTGDLSSVKYLIEMGADVHVRYYWALGRAAERGHLDVVKYLIENGADVHADDDYVLRWASRNGHLDVVKYLESVVAKN